MSEKVVAAVRTAPQTTEFREYKMPDIPEEAALLKVEVAGICGTDVKFYSKPPFEGPVIMGHENIGYIAKAGKVFQERKGLKEGDLVFGFTSGLADSALGRFVGAGGGKFTQKRNEFRRFMNRLRNELLRIAKGVQTDGDAQRALDELLLPDENLSTQSVKNALEFMYNNNVKTISRLQKKVDDLRAAKGMKKYDFGDQNTIMGVKIGGTP